MILVRHRITANFGSLFALSLAAAALISGKAHADTITLMGSTTFNAQIIAPYQHAIELATGHQLNVIPNKSAPGVVDLLEKKGDLAMISTPLEVVVALASQTHPNLPYEQLKNFPVAQTRVAFAVHPDNPVRAISSETLRRVLHGEIENWSDLGGKRIPIRLVMVREGGGVKATVEDQLLGGEPVAAKNAILVPNGPRIIRIVEQEPGALGLSQFNLVRQARLPELSLGKVVVQELNLVALGEPSTAMKAVIDAAKDVATPGIE
jgi:phosphate transport system substrate-binding protein